MFSASSRKIAYRSLITKERRTAHLVSLLIAAIGLAALVSGCGSSSGSGSEVSGSTRPTSVSAKEYSVESSTTVAASNIDKAQFLARARGICRKAWVTIVGNFAEYSEAQYPSNSKHARLVEAIHLSLLAGIDFHIFDNLQRLGAPHGEERALEGVIGAMQSAVERGQKELVPLPSLAKVAALFGEYNQLARRYGLDECLVDGPHLRKIRT